MVGTFITAASPNSIWHWNKAKHSWIFILVLLGCWKGLLPFQWLNFGAFCFQGGGNKYSERINQLLCSSVSSSCSSTVGQQLELLTPSCSEYFQSLWRLPWRADLLSHNVNTILRILHLKAEVRIDPSELKGISPCNRLLTTRGIWQIADDIATLCVTYVNHDM